MRICIFVHRFDDGGAEKTTIRLANEMAALGHEMTLAVRYDYGPLRSMAADNVCILDMKLPENGKLRKNIKNVAILRKIINSGEYDILMAVLAEMAEVAAVAHALGGKGDASCLCSPQHSFRGKNKLSPDQAQLSSFF